MFYLRNIRTVLFHGITLQPLGYRVLHLRELSKEVIEILNESDHYYEDG